MDEDDLYSYLLQRAVNFVSIRPRSRKEITDYLDKKARTNKKISSAVISRTISKLEELGYIDDLEFSFWLIRSRSNRKPRGIIAITSELYKKGIDKIIMKRAVEESSYNELEVAKKCLEVKKHLWKNTAGMEKKRKIFSTLTRLGFSKSVVYKLID